MLKKSRTKILKLAVLAMGALSLPINVFAQADTRNAQKPTTARRLEVLFLGSPDGHHRPLEQFRTIRRALGVKGINFTYANQPTALTKDNLAKYDALLVYGNHDRIEKDQEEALLDYSKNGGACVFLHSACGCFANSDAYIKLLGAQFQSHGTGVFEAKIVEPNHPIMKGFKGLECWDETYVHQKHNEDRTVLQKRDEEPWAWVRTHGKGRIFYTANGHDHRCWQHPNYQDLVLRGLLWSVGPEKARLVRNLRLPKLSYYKPEVPIIKAESWGKPLDRHVPHDVLQKGLPAKDSLKLAQVPAGFKLQLFAAEPHIINPIAINWDEKGRLWAVEAYDYPNSHVMNKPGQDRIKILEDTNYDGRADKASVFAEGLTICTSVVPYQDGCITTDGEEMVYLADTNNDGKADKRTVLFKGLKIWDTHACTSNLRFGFDGWIYATVGYSGLDVRTGGKHVEAGQGAFRFKPDGSDIEFLQSTTNNTWGIGFTEEGRVMGSTANNNPSWWVDVPLDLYNKAGVKAQLTPKADSTDMVYPITFDYLQVDCLEGFTAGAGHTLYTGDLFPKSWRNQRALICAPTAKLVAAPIVERHGAGFKTTHFENNIYASADAWSAPVAAEIGPDGAVYIADWYNSIVQHNVYGPGQEKGKGNAYISKYRDKEHGRIYRIVPTDHAPAPMPKLDSQEAVLDALGHPNLFWRITAQRLLLEKGKKEQLVAPLTKIARNDNTAAAHALYTLAGLGAQKEVEELAKEHLMATTPSLQLAAARHMPATSESAEHLLNIFENLTPDARHAALLKIASTPQSANVLATLKEKKGLIQQDPSLIQALTVAISIQGGAANEATEKTRYFPLSDSAKRGADIYNTATCTACHQANGEGVPETFPPLNQSDWLSRNHEDSIRVVLKGLSGPIKVLGHDYNGGMPAQESLTDQQITDVLNYVRNSWENKLGDITVEEVTRIRAEIKDRSTPFTAKDFEQPSPPKASHSYDFAKGLQDTIGKADATINGGSRPAKLGTNGIDLASNQGERSTQIKDDQYLNLANNIISDAAKQSVVGEVSIETWLEVSENRDWAWAWGFGSSDQGEDRSDGAGNSDYIGLIPMNGNSQKLRLTARAGGQEFSCDADAALAPNKMHHVIATFTRSHMTLYLNGELIGRRELPEKLNLTNFKNDNNWLGRSLFPDPLFDGNFRGLKIYPTALSEETVRLLSK